MPYTLARIILATNVNFTYRVLNTKSTYLYRVDAIGNLVQASGVTTAWPGVCYQFQSKSTAESARLQKGVTQPSQGNKTDSLICVSPW